MIDKAPTTSFEDRLKMLEWKKISGLLCIFGFVRELRPSEPYITEFLAGPWRNVTEDEVSGVFDFEFLIRIVEINFFNIFLLEIR